MPKRLLIANRGEIALRIARTARRLGIEVLGVFSSADTGLPHLRLCHRARLLDGDPQRVYLEIPKILDAARALKADAIHPGYGFLAENPAFASAVEEAKLAFVGPTPAQAQQFGDKLSARKAAQKAGVPVVPGSLSPAADPEEARRTAQRIGWPVLVKAAGGGGGRGMRLVEQAGRLDQALERARSESQSAFGDGRVFIEKYFPKVRHVEIQVLGDGRGQAVSLGERECSVQRRHQKLIEESPSLALPEAALRKMGRLAVRLAASVGYRGAGTVEFLVPVGSRARDFFFIEVNTRLQVEHPVTELRTGLDLVEEQLRVVGGVGFSFDPRALRPHGHAIEARVIAEDPEADFRPSLGTLDAVLWPAGPDVRVDAWAEAGLALSPHYDSLLGKVLAWGRSRDEALDRLTLALHETLIAPVQTTASFLAGLVNTPSFRKGSYDTRLVERRRQAAQRRAKPGRGKGGEGSGTLPLDAAVLAAAERLSRNGGATAQAPPPGERTLSAWQWAERDGETL